MTGLILSYKQLTTNQTASLARVEKQTDVKREIAYYKSKIGDIKSIDDFMKDQRIYNFAMDAFGLGDMKYAKAFMRKALTEGVDSSQAFSVNLADSRFKAFVDTFNFARYKDATTAFEKVKTGVVDKYVEAKFEQQAGNQSDALRLALYFKRKAPGLTSSFSILADKAVFEVVRTALGLPSAMSASDIDKQATLLSSRVNIEDFKDEAKLNKFITRFLAQYEMQNGSATASASNPALSILGSSSVNSSTLLSLQSLKRFGS